MSDAKYFQTTKKGEIKELQDDLNSVNKAKIKEAVKKVIAAMTVGKDVSMLFSDVIKSMGTDNIELKKLIYLYIINYARSQPEKAILVVSMFCKDATNHPNPLVRALALRTMGCIRVHRIAEYLCDPLHYALKDKDPYVRKTAAICVAKFYDLDPDLVIERGFIELLRNLLSDANPMVVANAVASLTDICESSGIDYFKIDNGTLSKLLIALNECSEWGRVFILEALSKFEAKAKQAKDICERVMPQLAHSNSAVVMAAVKVIIKFIKHLPQKEDQMKYCKKLSPSLLSLLSAPHEIQFVALRNIHLIIQKYPKLFENDAHVFYVKYNDESYIKNEKLEILVKLATVNNVHMILKEFEQYSQEVDVDFVKRSVQSIGRIAIKLEKAADAAMETISQLIKTGVSYIVQQCVIVIKDIFRRYPRRYEKIIVTLCDHLQDLNDYSAKASMIWIIGEYAERIIDAEDRLEYFIDSFEDENREVQLQLLTSTVKLFLKKPNKAKGLVQKVLHLATESSDNPDLRDRGYVYWRLLSTDPRAARKVVLAERPLISTETHRFTKHYLSSLLQNISSLSSVYHCKPNEFVKNKKNVLFIPFEEESESETESEISSDSDSSPEPQTKQKAKESVNNGNIMDELSYNGPPLITVFDSNKGDGLEMKIAFERKKNVPTMIAQCLNKGSDSISRIDIKFNHNNLGIEPRQTVPLNGTIGSGQAQIVDIPLMLSDNMLKENPLDLMVEMAARCIRMEKAPNVVMFACAIPGQILFDDCGIDNSLFLSEWKSIPRSDQEIKIFDKNRDLNITNIKQILMDNSFVIVNERKVMNRGISLYFSTQLKDAAVLSELSIANNGKCRMVTKSRNNLHLSRIVCYIGVSLIEQR